MAGEQDYKPDYDEDEHPADERLEEDGVLYTGGDYDASEVSTRNQEYLARDYVTALGTQENDDEDPVEIINRAQEREAKVGHDPNYLLHEYGPDKNFPKRPKEEILNDVEHLIREGDYKTSYIQVRVNEAGEVSLEGEVSSLELRRSLEQAIWDIPGVRDIKNRLVIALK